MVITGKMYKTRDKVIVIWLLMFLDVTFANSELGFYKAARDGKVDHNSELEFYKAAWDGKVDHIKQAIAEGTIDINWKNDNHGGNTALMIASLFNRGEVVKLLLDAGALVNQLDVTGSTALSYAASPVGRFGETDDSTIVKILIESHANINTREVDNGLTPLHRAAWDNQMNIVNELLMNGANPMIRSSANGRTPDGLPFAGLKSAGLTPAEMTRYKGNVDVANYIDSFTGTNSSKPKPKPKTLAEVARYYGNLEVANYIDSLAATKSSIRKPTTITTSANYMPGLVKMILSLVRNM